MKLVTYSLLLLICLNVDSKEVTLPNGESFSRDTLEAMFQYNSLILLQRFIYIDCVDAHPETQQDHFEALNGNKFKALESSLSKFIGDPRKTWEARKKDNSYGVGPYEPPSLDSCKKSLKSTSEFVNSLETAISDKELSLMMELAKELSLLNENQLKQVTDVSMGITK